MLAPDRAIQMHLVIFRNVPMAPEPILGALRTVASVPRPVQQLCAHEICFQSAKNMVTWCFAACNLGLTLLQLVSSKGETAFGSCDTSGSELADPFERLAGIPDGKPPAKTASHLLA